MKIPKLFLILGLIIVSFASKAQLIVNKLSIYHGYSVGAFHGPGIIKQGNFTSPSQFANYNKLSGYALKCIKYYNPRLSYGLSYNHQFADTWESPEYSDFDGSSNRFISVSPLIRFQSILREEGVFNRLQVFMELGPNFGISNLRLTNPVFDIRDKYGPISGPMKSSDFFWGLKVNPGIDYSLNQSLGVYLYYSIDVNRVSSKLYSDKFFIRSFINAGILLKLRKDKYFYRTLVNY